MLSIPFDTLFMCWLTSLIAFVLWGFVVASMHEANAAPGPDWRRRKALKAIGFLLSAVAFTLHAFLFLVRLVAVVWRTA